MKIGKTTEAFSSEALAQSKAKTKAGADAGKTAPNGAAASVTLSSLSSTLKSVEADIKEPSFDAAKVESIKKAIRDGQFKVDGSAVADKLISSATDLLSTKSS